MTRSRGWSTALAVMAAVIVVAVWLGGIAGRRLGEPAAQCADSAAGGPGSCVRGGMPASAETPSPPSIAGAPVLRADVACRHAGYLCAGLADSASIVIERWKDSAGVMVVHVPPPPFEDPGTARDLQDAAADGILSWNGQPFPVVVDRRGSRPARVEVTWRPTLGGNRLGLTHTQWSRSGGLQVLSLELSTRMPSDPSRALDPRVVRLTAAHEMGHALGLPHSDQPRDVMYPDNTATALTARDYLTVEALYALENGTRIVR